MALQDGTGKYPGIEEVWEEKPDGTWVVTGRQAMEPSHMYPDVILDAQLKATRPFVRPAFEKHLALEAAGKVPQLNTHRLLVAEPKLSWEQTVEIVTAAFTQFSPALGQKVAEVLADPSRVALEWTKEGDASAYCSPPGHAGLKQAKIFFTADGTISDAVYLAHELGHLLAHDAAQASGMDGDRRETWMPRQLAEIPAFVTQHILYDYLLHQQGDAGLQNAARQHMAGEISRGLYATHLAYARPASNVDEGAYAQRVEETLGPQWKKFIQAEKGGRDMSGLHAYETAMTIGTGLFATGLAKNPAVMGALFARGKDTDILSVFAAAGITTEKQLEEFFTKAAQRAVTPVDDIFAAGMKVPAVKIRPSIA